MHQSGRTSCEARAGTRHGNESCSLLTLPVLLTCLPAKATTAVRVMQLWMYSALECNPGACTLGPVILVAMHAVFVVTVTHRLSLH